MKYAVSAVVALALGLGLVTAAPANTLHRQSNANNLKSQVAVSGQIAPSTMRQAKMQRRHLAKHVAPQRQHLAKTQRTARLAHKTSKPAISNQNVGVGTSTAPNNAQLTPTPTTPNNSNTGTGQ